MKFTIPNSIEILDINLEPVLVIAADIESYLAGESAKSVATRLSVPELAWLRAMRERGIKRSLYQPIKQSK